jgi:hypothetical protein
VDHFWNLVPELLARPELDDAALARAIAAKAHLTGYQAGKTKARPCVTAPRMPGQVLGWEFTLVCAQAPAQSLHVCCPKRRMLASELTEDRASVREALHVAVHSAVSSLATPQQSSCISRGTCCLAHPMPSAHACSQHCLRARRAPPQPGEAASAPVVPLHECRSSARVAHAWRRACGVPRSQRGNVLCFCCRADLPAGGPDGGAGQAAHRAAQPQRGHAAAPRARLRAAPAVCARAPRRADPAGAAARQVSPGPAHLRSPNLLLFFQGLRLTESAIFCVLPSSTHWRVGCACCLAAPNQAGPSAGRSFVAR